MGPAVNRACVAAAVLCGTGMASAGVGWISMKDAPPTRRDLRFESLSVAITRSENVILEPHFAQAALVRFSGDAEALGFSPCEGRCTFGRASGVSLGSDDTTNTLGVSGFSWRHGDCPELRLGFGNTPVGPELSLLPAGKPSCTASMHLVLSDAKRPQLSFNEEDKSDNQRHTPRRYGLGPNASVGWRTRDAVLASIGTRSGLVLSDDALSSVRSVVGKLAKPLAPIVGAPRRVCSAAAGEVVLLGRGAWNLEKLRMRDATMELTVESKGVDLLRCPGKFHQRDPVSCPTPVDACEFNWGQWRQGAWTAGALIAGALGLFLSVLGFKWPK